MHKLISLNKTSIRRTYKGGMKMTKEMAQKLIERKDVYLTEEGGKQLELLLKGVTSK